MYWVYILYGQKDRNLYVGQTNNLGKKLQLHKAGKVLATRYRKPLILIHKENYETLKAARRRERFLKSLWGGREKKKILLKFLQQGPSTSLKIYFWKSALGASSSAARAPLLHSGGQGFKSPLVHIHRFREASASPHNSSAISAEFLFGWLAPHQQSGL